MYRIMRKLPYRVEHFFKPNFMASQFFVLCDMIQEEVDNDNKAYEKQQKKLKK